MTNRPMKNSIFTKEEPDLTQVTEESNEDLNNQAQARRD